LVSKELDLPWISTDHIRKIIRVTAEEKNYPALFCTKGYTAERFLNEFSAEDTVELEMNEGKEMWPTIMKFIEKDSTWKDGFIIEGISILPSLVAKDFKNNKDIKAVFLIDEDADRIRDIVFKRGLWSKANTYSDDVKEKEVEWALLFSNKIKEEAKKYNYPFIEVCKNKDDLLSMLKIVDSDR
jgi:2-phosphoglycerate kinase